MLLLDLTIPWLSFQSHTNCGALCLPSDLLLCSVSPSLVDLSSDIENVQRLLPHGRGQH